MPDELSHTFDLPKTVGTAMLSLDGGEGIYVSGLACPVQKTMLSGEKPATIIGGTGEPFYAYDGNGTVMVDFVGWTDDAGNTYHIGDKPELTADTTFYAAWSRNDGMAIAQAEQTEPDDDSATGSALSEGRLAIVVGVTAFAVGFLAAMFIFRKKKSASANGAEK